MAQDILFPVGRLVGGSLYNERDKLGVDGKPMTGPDGKRVKAGFSFGVAYPKAASTHWAQTEWGAKIWAEGHAGFPNGEAKAPSFAWKIIDGDSQIPNKRGNKPCDNEGFPGHWVVWFSGSYAPKIVNANGTQPIIEPNAVKTGYFVQVFGNVKDNKPSQSPGVYLNYVVTALSAYGPEIATNSVDAAAVGFGASPLPAGASATPLAGMTGGPATLPAAPGAPAVPSTALVPPLSVPVVPDPAILAPPVRTMTAKAGGATREQFIAAGWTDEKMITEGYMA